MVFSKYDRLNSMMLWHGANQYLNAAKILFVKEKPKHHRITLPNPPAYFLVCQAIELGFKAYLRGWGESETFLTNKCGHDLLLTLEASEEGGLSQIITFDSDERKILIIADSLYRTKALQFTIVGLYKCPSFELLLAIAQRLVRAVRPFCLKNMHRHSGHPTAVSALRASRKK